MICLARSRHIFHGADEKAEQPAISIAIENGNYILRRRVIILHKAIGGEVISRPLRSPGADMNKVSDIPFYRQALSADALAAPSNAKHAFTLIINKYID